MKDNVDYAKIIKAKINLVDFLSKDLRLFKSGSNYKALCPFHNEKTPSFTINQEKIVLIALDVVYLEMFLAM